MKKYIFIITLLCMLAAFCGCRKAVEVVAPITSVNASVVYSTDATAISVMTGLYATMSGQILTYSEYPGLSSDELVIASVVNSPSLSAYYTNSLTSTIAGFELWNSIYPNIFVCNSSIENLNASTSLSPSVKNQLIGEAKFMRAFYYFYLTNLYGDIPMPVTSDYQVNASLTKTQKQAVYQQVINDLHSAQLLLNTNYVDASLAPTTGDRLRPSKWTATALLARADLYAGNAAGADSAATALITNTASFNLCHSLDTVFLRSTMNNKEAIWQLQSVSSTVTNSAEGLFFIIPSTGPSISFPVYLNQNLLNAFETSDNRRTHWVNNVTVSGTTYYFPYKYKVNKTAAPVTEYSTLFRLAEQYLIRAEARIAEGNLPGAASDLNAIRNRAGLPNYGGAMTTTALLAAILHERQVELFTEYGHRWLDLKRTGNVNSVMSVITPQKGSTWSPNWQLYPVPAFDLLRDPNLVQNSGY